jgi:hypothetical protein
MSQGFDMWILSALETPSGDSEETDGSLEGLAQCGYPTATPNSSLLQPLL